MNDKWTDEDIRTLFTNPILPYQDVESEAGSDIHERKMEKLFARFEEEERVVAKRRKDILRRRFLAAAVACMLLVATVTAIGPEKVWAETQRLISTYLYKEKDHTTYIWEQREQIEQEREEERETEKEREKEREKEQEQARALAPMSEIEYPIFAIPEGFSRDETLSGEGTSMDFYTNSDGAYILILRAPATGNVLSVETENSVFREYRIGDLLLHEYTRDRDILTIWEEDQTVFTIQSDADFDAIRTMIETMETQPETQVE